MRHIRQAVGYAVAMIAVLGIVFGAVSACGSPEARLPVLVAPGHPGGLNVVGQGEVSALGVAGQAAAVITALGSLGRSQGTARNVHDLAMHFSAEGQALLDELRAGAGGVIADEPAPEHRAVLADLRARTGEQFDQVWLRAAEQMQQQVRDAANGVLTDENESEEAKAAAQRALGRLDSLDELFRQATGPTGAGTPRAVHAGSGGSGRG